MPSATVDRLLQDIAGGDRAAFDCLMCEVYPNLLVIARALLRDQRSEHPFEAEDLVHEAYLKLVRYRDVKWRGPSHFFGAITQTMRRLLIDHARAASTLKRKGTLVPLTQEVANTQGNASLDPCDEWTDLLSGLAKEQPRGAKVVDYRCTRGLTIQETADVLGVSHSTVSTDWRRAQAWLGRELGMATGANGHAPLLTDDASTVKP